MKKPAFVLSGLLALPTGLIGQTTWTVDKAHSSVKFSVSYLVISEVEGNFSVFSGSIRSGNSDFDNATVEFTVDVNSIDTDNELRDTNLKSKDFFESERYPIMRFQSASMKRIDEKNYLLEGDLTIRDVSRRVPFKVSFGGITKDGYGNTKAGFKASAVIDRHDYGLTWKALADAGVGREVAVGLNLQFALQNSP